MKLTTGQIALQSVGTLLWCALCVAALVAGGEWPTRLLYVGLAGGVLGVALAGVAVGVALLEWRRRTAYWRGVTRDVRAGQVACKRGDHLWYSSPYAGEPVYCGRPGCGATQPKEGA